MQNKDKPKKGHLPQDMMEENRYLAAHTVSDVWICYPWEATYAEGFRIDFTVIQADVHRDIDEHDRLANSQSVM